MKKLLKIFFLVIWGGLFILFPFGLALGAPPDGIPWKKLETKHATICYQSREDLKKFNSKIKYTPGAWGLKDLFSSSSSNDLKSKIKRKVDAVYQRAQEILDMRKRMKKVIIHLYPSQKDLHVAYGNIYKESFRSYKTNSKPRAWYTHSYKTIYLNLDDLHEGILAHEMAHAIIDHYLLVRPPSATAEILARYVDKHLLR